MKRAIALLLAVAMLVGVGPAAGLAFAGEREHGASPTLATGPAHQAQSPCLTLTELHTLRQEIAARVLQSTHPVETYRAELRKTQDILAVQQRHCLIGLHAALVREEASRLVRLDLGDGGGPPDPSDSNPDVDLGRSILDAVDRAYRDAVSAAGGPAGVGAIAVGAGMVAIGATVRGRIGAGIAAVGGAILNNQSGVLQQNILDKLNGLFGGGGNGGGGGGGGAGGASGEGGREGGGGAAEGN